MAIDLVRGPGEEIWINGVRVWPQKLAKPSRGYAKKLKAAADNADWGQVARNHVYGPPCFHLEENGLFCLRSQPWDGHDKRSCHEFMPLSRLVAALLKRDGVTRWQK